MRDGAFTISGNLVDVLQKEIFPAALHIESGKIIRIVPESWKYDTYITPGLVDAHVHIERSMLYPAEFARHGPARHPSPQDERQRALRCRPLLAHQSL